MPAFNFQRQWADEVEAGARAANGVSLFDLEVPELKRTTIRNAGRAKPGDTLYLYTGQRTKECRKLGEVLCLAVTPVRIAAERLNDAPYIYLGEQIIAGDALERFARLDTAGLWCADQFMAFFDKTYGLPFIGALYCW